MDSPEFVEFKTANISRPKTRQSEEEEPEEEVEIYEAGMIYAIIADTRDYSDGFCLAKCTKSQEDGFLGIYLEKSSVPSIDQVLFKETSSRSKFYTRSVLSSVVSIIKKSDVIYAASQSEIDEIIFSANSIAIM